MRVIVTGGAGFIGSWIGDKLLQAGHEPWSLDDYSGGFKRNVEGWTKVRTDLIDPDWTWDAFQQIKPELVIHCAAFPAEVLSHWMRGYCYSQNLGAWANVVNSSINLGVRKLVTLSSIGVYGAQEPPFGEELAPRPQDPYAIAKAAMEADLRALGETHDVEWLIFRPHNVIGPRQSLRDPYRNVVAIFMRQAMAGEPITVFGDGSQVRAFSYVGDVANAIAQLATSSFTRRTVNVGGDEPISVLELARRIKTLLGSPSPIVHLPERHEVQDAWCSHEVLEDLMGRWEPTSIDTALEETAEWAKTIEIGPLRRYDYEMTERMISAWL